MRIDVMEKGEMFIGMEGMRIFLRKKSGEVRIVSLVEDEDGIRVDPRKEVIIGFGKGMVTFGDVDDGIEVTTF